jgi:hypothetical protein
MDSYNATVYMAPKIGFGTAARPGLLEGDTETPGPGSYVLKTTMAKNPNSNFRSPCSFSMRGREKFGSPDLKASDRTTQMEPGPGAYGMYICLYYHQSVAIQCIACETSRAAVTAVAVVFSCRKQQC